MFINDHGVTLQCHQSLRERERERERGRERGGEREGWRERERESRVSDVLTST